MYQQDIPVFFFTPQNSIYLGKKSLDRKMLPSLAPALEKLKLPPKSRGSYQANPELAIFNVLGENSKFRVPLLKPGAPFLPVFPSSSFQCLGSIPPRIRTAKAPEPQGLVPSFLLGPGLLEGAASAFRDL